jgi:hypothetical protein
MNENFFFKLSRRIAGHQVNTNDPHTMKNTVSKISIEGKVSLG